MVSNENEKCPYCGGKLASRGMVKRIVKVGNGETSIVKIKRCYCLSCGKWHRIIPDYIIPYKHYRKEIVDGTVDLNDIFYEDYPCDMTKKRWQSQ